MFSWLFGKSQKEDTKLEKIAEPQLSVSRADIEFFIEVMLTRLGISGAAIYYAIMQGFTADTIHFANEKEFNSLIYSDPKFSNEGIKKATEKLLKDMPYLSAWLLRQKQLQNTISDDGQIKVTIDDLEVLYKVLADFERIGTENAVQLAGINLKEHLPNVAIAIRSRDVSYIKEKMDEKKSFMKPLLLRAKARGKNKYGDLDLTEYNKEIDEFINAFFPQDKMTFFYNRVPRAMITSQFEEWLDEVEEQIDIPQDGVDFEHWCAEKIREQGWIATVSQASGDQGVDIIAIKDDFVVAIQCKRYSKPIGNKAIQEAYTGQQHYHANMAVVVGTGGFTRAAQELASNTGVLLLDAEYINDFSQQVKDFRK